MDFCVVVGMNVSFVQAYTLPRTLPRADGKAKAIVRNSPPKAVQRSGAGGSSGLVELPTVPREGEIVDAADTHAQGELGAVALVGSEASVFLGRSRGTAEGV